MNGVVFGSSLNETSEEKAAAFLEKVNSYQNMIDVLIEVKGFINPYSDALKTRAIREISRINPSEYKLGIKGGSIDSYIDYMRKRKADVVNRSDLVYGMEDKTSLGRHIMFVSDIRAVTDQINRELKMTAEDLAKARKEGIQSEIDRLKDKQPEPAPDPSPSPEKSKGVGIGTIAAGLAAIVGIGAVTYFVFGDKD